MARRPHQRSRTLRRAALVMGVAVMAACGRQSTPAPATATPVAPSRTDAEIRELDIVFFGERAKRDPTGAYDLSRLAALYLARGRETGDPRDAELAEAAARRSIRNRSAHNSAAAFILQSALLAQHRFQEALQLAIAARDAEPENAALRAALGEIWMELGQYDSARVAFDGLRVSLGDLAVAPRRSRWAEITGDTARARLFMGAALATARRQSMLPREQLAWYSLRVGDVALRAGRPLAADSAYRAGLAARPDDHRLLSALAHSALVQGRWRDAADHGERAIAVSLDPATLGTLSDAYSALGDTAKAAEYARVLDVSVLRQPGAYHRAWSLFLLDHGRHVNVVARKVREELRTRRDVYAYDLLAWSLHKQGRHADASAAMKRALAQGTLDAQLFYHAGEIDRALGRTESARAHLERALALNPYFHATQPAAARAALAAMNAAPAEVAAQGDAGQP